MLDPFCGGGTTLVEGMVAGLSVSGSDLSPVALLVARSRTALTSEEERAELTLRARTLVAESPTGVRLPQALFERLKGWYQPHVLHELAGLRAGLLRCPDDRVTDLLWACFSSLLVKVSARRSETDGRKVAAVTREIVSRLPEAGLKG